MSTRGPNRIESVDNAKGILIFLVVLGHLLEPKVDLETTHRILYFLIYSFHMPAFVFLSGMLAKPEISSASMRKWFVTLILPVFLFQCLYEIPELFINGKLSDYSLNLRPYWTLWFLLSLFCWRILLPCVVQLRFPLLLAVLASLLAGYVRDTGYFLGISRTIYFFPFFLFGHYYGKPLLESARKINNKLLPVCGMLLVGLFFVLNIYMNKRWLWGAHSYDEFGPINIESGLFRLELYAVSVISMISFLLLVPAGKSIWSKFGQHSMPVFLWHVLIVQGLNHSLLDSFHSSLGEWSILICILESSLIVVILSTDFVTNQTHRLLSMAERLVTTSKTSCPQDAISDKNRMD